MGNVSQCTCRIGVVDFAVGLVQEVEGAAAVGVHVVQAVQAVRLLALYALDALLNVVQVYIRIYRFRFSAICFFTSSFFFFFSFFMLCYAMIQRLILKLHSRFLSNKISFDDDDYLKATTQSY